MKTIQLTLYKFNELSEDAQQTAIEELADINVDHEWWQMIYEQIKENANIEITSFDLDKFQIEGNFISSPVDSARAIIAHYSDNNELTTLAQKYLDSRSTNDWLNSKHNGEFLEDVLDVFFKWLQEVAGELTSETAIIETIEANDYDFTESGELY